MKKKERANIAGQTAEELQSLLAETTDKLVKLVLNKATSQSRNNREARALRLKRAVTLTALRKKEIQHG